MPKRVDLGRLAISIFGGVYAAWSALAAQRETTSFSLRVMFYRQLGWRSAQLVSALAEVFLVVFAFGCFLWVAYVFRPPARAARLAAGATLLIVVVDSAVRTSDWSRTAMSVLLRQDGLWLVTGVISTAVVIFLPTPRSWRVPAAGRRQTALMVGLWLLPALVALPLYYQTWSMIEQLRPEFQRVAAVDIPLPPGAQELKATKRRGSQALSFHVTARYPSTAVAQFYDQWFISQGWKRTDVANWGPIGNYESQVGRPVEPHAQWSYGEDWRSADGKLEAMLGLSYDAPPGAPQFLPLDRWQAEWLNVERVSLRVYPTAYPFSR